MKIKNYLFYLKKKQMTVTFEILKVYQQNCQIA